MLFSPNLCIVNICPTDMIYLVVDAADDSPDEVEDGTPDTDIRVGQTLTVQQRLAHRPVIYRQ